jgi:alkanesulfonate monooxygenase SsuD/methylene tetrahydromethanopterin reductase-like flavin-dependent oxidoreductase (luciferase family)
MMTIAGVYLPVGILGEHKGRSTADIWDRILHLAELAESLGFRAIRVPDHLMHCKSDEASPTLEVFGVLSAVAMVTNEATLGQAVLAAPFRNPAYVVKQVTTLDVVSRGRAELGLGAGWCEHEFRAFGYGYPPPKERLAALRETLEIATSMLRDERATFEGAWASVINAPAEPKGYNGHRIPVVVGGNGQKVTWRLAARYADELNLDGPTVQNVRDWMPIIHQRCEEIDRDPATLRVSAQMWWERPGNAEFPRVELLQQLREIGLSHVFTDFPAAAESDEPFHHFAEDCRTAGLRLG